MFWDSSKFDNNSKIKYVIMGAIPYFALKTLTTLHLFLIFWKIKEGTLFPYSSPANRTPNLTLLTSSPGGGLNPAGPYPSQFPVGQT